MALEAQSGLDCLLARVEGRVQGVGFREACVHQAQALRLAGWVRNRADGTVEVLVLGPADAVSRLLNWLREGPPFARVTRVAAKPVTPPADLMPHRFERRSTK